jgi:DNA-binding MarR family transcriptional regulator
VRDSRRSLISITPAGRDLIELIAPESEARYAYIEARFGRENLGALYDMLQSLVDALADPAPAFGDLQGEERPDS